MAGSPCFQIERLVGGLPCRSDTLIGRAAFQAMLLRSDNTLAGGTYWGWYSWHHEHFPLRLATYFIQQSKIKITSLHLIKYSLISDFFKMKISFDYGKIKIRFAIAIGLKSTAQINAAGSILEVFLILIPKLILFYLQHGPPKGFNSWPVAP